ncbi:MAG: tyrosine protein phosphatase [Blastocatellia bacterium]
MRTEMYRINRTWPGRIAIVPRPRGGDWLEDEVRAWADAGLQVIVSLLETDEARDLGLEHEGACCEAAGMVFISFPIVDRSVPVSRLEASALVRRLCGLLLQGKNIGVHCRQGIGRAALITASVLIAMGETPQAAIVEISAARGLSVPETLQQHEWLKNFALPSAA